MLFLEVQHYILLERLSFLIDIWKFPAYATKHTIIHKNDRICQFRIVEKQPKIEFDIVNKLEDNDRGGFGSTGIQ